MSGSRYRPAAQGAGRTSSDDEDVDWTTSFWYYGTLQTLFLGTPAIWLALETPVAETLVPWSLTTAVVCCPLVIAAGRQGVLGEARWPTLSNDQLGTGSTDGYAALLRRGVHVCVTLGLATFAGGVAGQTLLGTTSIPVAYAGTVLVAAGLATPGTLLAATLEGRSRNTRLARAGYYALGLALTWGAAVQDRPTSALVVFCLLLVASVLSVVWG